VIVRGLYRYPVKSMGGEAMERCAVDANGLAGDRRFGVVDEENGHVASAKQPRRWAALLSMHAAYRGAPSADTLHVTLDDGRDLAWTDPALAAALAHVSGRRVRLAEAPISTARDVRIDRIATEFDKEPGVEDDISIGLASAPGMLFDLAPLHLITSSTLDALGDARRFRPNIVIDTAGEPPFQENTWINRRFRIGETLTLLVILSTQRCVIPTLAQGDLGGDPTLLKRIDAANRVDVALARPSPCVGVYAVVIAPGEIAVGDDVTSAD
jgi:uncharacterized protein YcbX